MLCEFQLDILHRLAYSVIQVNQSVRTKSFIYIDISVLLLFKKKKKVLSSKILSE